jgi:hypothetical protein
LSQGYEINFYQSTYLDFCGLVKKASINKCLTYNHYGASSAALRGLGDIEKAKITLFKYGNRSFFAKYARIFYVYHYQADIIAGLALPELPDWNDRVGPIPVLPVFDRLIADVSSSPGGQMFFAHLLIPHYPFTVDSACQVRRPVLEWANRYRDSESLRSGLANTPASRLAHYEGNMAQIRCAISKLDKLFAAMKARGTFGDAVIIIHGDHGSRIVLTEPRIEFQSRLMPQDYYDAFSTLYVVKSPAIAPGYDTRRASLPELLRRTVSGNQADSISLDEKEVAVVFLRGDVETDLLEVPMPEMTAGQDSQ